jgi:hypothetical protein
VEIKRKSIAKISLHIWGFEAYLFCFLPLVLLNYLDIDANHKKFGIGTSFLTQRTQK